MVIRDGVHIVYFETSVVPIGRGFSFCGHGKVNGKSMLEKRGHPGKFLLLSRLL